MTELRLIVPDDLVELVTARVLAELEQRPATPYMTVPEAAEYARCKPQRIYDLLSARRLRKHKDGSRVLIRRDELDDYLTSRAA